VDYLFKGDITFSDSVIFHPAGFNGEVSRGDKTCAYQLRMLLIRSNFKNWSDHYWLEDKEERSNLSSYQAFYVKMFYSEEKTHLWSL